jgi:hypothetical protein
MMHLTQEQEQKIDLQQLTQEVKKRSEIMKEVGHILMKTKVEKCKAVLADGEGRFCAVGAMLHELYNWNPDHQVIGLSYNIEVENMFNDSPLSQLPRNEVNIIMELNDISDSTLSTIGQQLIAVAEEKELRLAHISHNLIY